MIRRLFTQAKFLKAEGRIRLNDNEKELFERIKPVMPDAVLRVAGGWVRDKLMGKESNDIDISIDKYKGIEAAVMIKAAIKDTGSFGAVRANPAASKHLETACIKIMGFEVDLVHLRTESYAESRIPSISIGTPKEDAYRRDLTINSMFYNLNEEIIEDWTGFGLDDLDSKTARTPLKPLETLTDDPLRALRIIRFSSRFGLTIIPELLESLKQPSVKEALKQKISRERIGKEFTLMLRGVNPKAAIERLISCEYLDSLFGVNEFVLHEDFFGLLENITTERLSLEKFTAALLLSYSKSHDKALRPSYVPQYICENSLKLPNKEMKCIKLLLESLEEFNAACESLDLGDAGMLVIKLGALWQEIFELSLHPARHTLRELIGVNDLEDFWKEAPLINGLELQEEFNIERQKIKEVLLACSRMKAMNRNLTKSELKSHLKSLKP